MPPRELLEREIKYKSKTKAPVHARYAHCNIAPANEGTRHHTYDLHRGDRLTCTRTTHMAGRNCSLCYSYAQISVQPACDKQNHEDDLKQ